MFGLVDKSLSGDEGFSEELEPSAVSWKTGALPADTTLTSLQDGTKTVYAKGTVLRVYTGKIPTGGGDYYTSPTNGIYILELPPTAESKYWNAYKESDEAKALIASPEWKATQAARQKRVFLGPIPPGSLGSLDGKGLKEGSVDAAGLPGGPAAGTAEAAGGKEGGGPVPGEGEGTTGDGGGKDKPRTDVPTDDKDKDKGKDKSSAGLWILLAVAAFFFFAAREEKKTRKQLKAEA